MKPRTFFGYVVDTNFIISVLLLVVVALGAGFYGLRFVKATVAKRELRANRERIHTLVESEELILELTPRLKGLNKSVRNLRLPDHHSHPPVSYTHLTLPTKA